MDLIFTAFWVLLAVVVLCIIIALHWFGKGWTTFTLSSSDPFSTVTKSYASTICPFNDRTLFNGLCSKRCNNDYDCDVGADGYPVPFSCYRNNPMALLPEPHNTDNPTFAGVCSTIDGTAVTGVCGTGETQLGAYCLKTCDDSNTCPSGTCMAFGGATQNIPANSGICIGKNDVANWQSLVGSSKNVSNIVFRDCNFSVTIDGKTYTQDVTQTLTNMVAGLDYKGYQQGTGFLQNLLNPPSFVQKPVESLQLTLPLNPFSFTIDTIDASTLANLLENNISVDVKLQGKYKDLNI